MPRKKKPISVARELSMQSMPKMRKEAAVLTSAMLASLSKLRKFYGERAEDFL